jgi:hypothetical protein
MLLEAVVVLEKVGKMMSYQAYVIPQDLPPIDLFSEGRLLVLGSS